MNPAFRRYNFVLFSMCGLAGLLYGIDMGLIAAALPYIKVTCGFSESQLSSIVAAVMLGCVPGVMCAAWVAEWMGRLAALKVTALVFMVAVPVICLSNGNFWVMLVGRLLQGVGCGFMGVTASLYVVETATSENRGKGTGMIQLVLSVGLVVAALIGLGATVCFGGADVADVPLADKNRAWQMMFWISIVPAVVLFVGLFFLKESPRWLYKRGRRKEAYEALCMNNSPEVARRIIADLDANAASQEINVGGGEARQDSIFQGKYLFPLTLAILIPLFNQASGVNSLMNYSVVLMQRAGLVGTAANWADALIKLANLFFTCIAMSFVDRKGRKFLLTIGTSGVTLGLIAVGLLFAAVERGWLTGGLTTGWIIVGAFIIFVGGFAIGPGVCVWLAMTELMPLRFRAGGMMVAQFIAMGISYALAQTFLPWSKAFGDSSIFLTLSVFGLLYFLTVVFFLPETKGKSLEEIEMYFASRR